jgi:hypothetical protein
MVDWVKRDLLGVAEELLRSGFLDEDYRGGYCAKAPTDPTLRLIGRTGAKLVEISYTVTSKHHAMDEAAVAFNDLLATVSENAQARP